MAPATTDTTRRNRAGIDPSADCLHRGCGWEYYGSNAPRSLSQVQRVARQHVVETNHRVRVTSYRVTTYSPIEGGGDE